MMDDPAQLYPISSTPLSQFCYTFPQYASAWERSHRWGPGVVRIWFLGRNRKRIHADPSYL